GPKIFGNKKNQESQFNRIISQILNRKSTKHAYLSLSNAKDYKYRDEKFSSPPCTIGLHFYVRENQLNLTTYMRSNDAYLGLPHDLFCFTMLQEVISCRTDIPLGSYTHIATSMHIYKPNFDNVKDYLKEGLQEPIEMPIMKNSDDNLLDHVSHEFDIMQPLENCELMDEYWRDYVLFANKHFNSYNDKEFWKDQFHNETMRRIASNSIGK
ncbi:hypothetical protein LCGC14_1648380, partial [marine sediment metagenome]